MRSFFILIILLSLTATGLITANAEVSGEQNLLIFYSNDVIGETEPCG